MELLNSGFALGIPPHQYTAWGTALLISFRAVSYSGRKIPHRKAGGQQIRTSLLKSLKKLILRDLGIPLYNSLSSLRNKNQDSSFQSILLPTDPLTHLCNGSHRQYPPRPRMEVSNLLGSHRLLWNYVWSCDILWMERGNDKGHNQAHTKVCNKF